MCGTSIMGLMMLGAAMGDTHRHPRRRRRCRGRAGEARRAGRERVRRRGREPVPRQVTAFSNTTVKRLRSLRDKKARRERRAVPRRRAADHRRGARQRPAARDHRFLAPRARAIRWPPRSSPRPKRPAAKRSRPAPDILVQDDRQGQSADAARRLPPARDVARPRSTARRRRCGSSPRRCAIPAISAPSCAPATRSAPAG